MNTFIEFLEHFRSSDPVIVEAIKAGYSNIYETISEPMTALKRYTQPNSKDTPLTIKLAPFISATRDSKSEATKKYDIAISEWWYFGTRINDIWNDGEVEVGDEVYEDEEGLISFMNSEPTLFNKLFDRYSADNSNEGDTNNYMDYSKPLVNKWLVHFSNNADSIFMNGFKYGNEDMSKLGLTDSGSTKGKNHGEYLFAYDMDDANKYGASSGRHGKFKYGNSAVAFIGSGIKFWHHSDEEPQVVFDRHTIQGCFLIEKGDVERDDTRDDAWNITGHLPGRKYRVIATKETFDEALEWCRDNFSQYKKYYPWNVK